MREPTTSPKARIACFCALAMFVPSIALADAPTIDSVSLGKARVFLDLEPLDLSADARLREDGGAWTRRQLRAWMWRERARITACMEQTDRVTPLAPTGGAITITLHLDPAGASTTDEGQGEELAGCLDDIWKALPRAALTRKVDYTLILVDPRLDEEIQSIYSTRGKLQIAGASLGVLPSYESLETGMLEAPRTEPLGTPPLLRQREEASRHEETLAPCYREARERNPDLAGDVSMTIATNAKGRVERIWWDRNTTGDAQLLGCIEKRARGWRTTFGEANALVGLGFHFEPPTPTTRTEDSSTRPLYIAGSPGIGTPPGAALFSTIERHVDMRRGRVAACHKRHSPTAAAGAFLLRVEADTRYRTITHAAIIRRDKPNPSLEDCIERAILERTPTFPRQATRTRHTLDWTIEFLAPHRGDGRLDADIEGRLLASEPPPSPIALLGPTRVLEEDQLEHAARIYEANGYTEQAIALWMQLANMTADPVTRARRIERALDDGEHFTRPDFYHQLLLTVARTRSNAAAVSSIDTARQSEAELAKRITREAKRTHRRALDQQDRASLKHAIDLYETALTFAPPAQEPDIHFYLAECLLERSEHRRAAEHFVTYRRLAPKGELLGEAVRGELFARKHLTRESCEQMRHPRSAQVPASCFEQFLRRADVVSSDIQLDSRLRAEVLGWSIDLLREFGREDMAAVREQRLLEDFDPLDIPVQFAP